MAGTGDLFWSYDEEHYSHDSLAELIQEIPIEAGEEVFYAEGEVPDPGAWVDAEDVIELLASRADDEGFGDWAEDYPEVTPEAKAELTELLQTWARKHCQPSFYRIVNARPHLVTAEEIAEARKP